MTSAATQLRILILTLLSGVSFAVGMSFAQQAPQAQEARPATQAQEVQPAAQPQEVATATSLDLSSDTQTPGSEVILALTLSIPDGVNVGAAVSKVIYPSKLLTFTEGRRGLSAEAVGAEFNTVVKTDETNPESSVLEVTVSGKPGDPLPSGILAELAFKISQDAPLEQNIVLKNTVQVMTAEDPPKPIEAVTGKDGEVKVTENPPVFACFFYMH